MGRNAPKLDAGVMIGIGGSGATTIQYLKRRFGEVKETDVRFLAIDTDRCEEAEEEEK